MNQPQPIYLNFDASQVEPQQPFEVLPAGDYTVALVGAKVLETSKKTGHYLAMDYAVQEGSYKGRHVFDNLNLWNASQQASEIAWRQLSGLCHAAGVLQVQTVDQLFNIPVVAKLNVESDPQYGDQNNIRGFSKAGGQAGAPTQPAAPAQNEGDTVPWGPGTQQPAPTAAPAPAPAPQPAPPAEAATPAPTPGATPAQQSGTEAPPWVQQQQAAPAQQQQGEETPPWARQS